MKLDRRDFFKIDLLTTLFELVQRIVVEERPRVRFNFEVDHLWVSSLHQD
jgi:hypothetical protein